MAAISLSEDASFFLGLAFAKEHELTQKEIAVLLYIRQATPQDGPITPATIATALHCSQQYVGRVLQTLRLKKLITERPIALA